MPLKKNVIEVIFNDSAVLKDNKSRYELVLNQAIQYYQDLIEILSKPKDNNKIKLSLSFQGSSADPALIPKQEVELYNTLSLIYHEYEKSPTFTFFRYPVSSNDLILAVAGKKQIEIKNYRSILILFITAAATNNVLTKEEYEDIDKVSLRIKSLEKAIEFISLINKLETKDKKAVVENSSDKNSLYVIIQKLKIQLQENLTEYNKKYSVLEQEQPSAKILKSLNNIISIFKSFESMYKDALKIRQINSDEKITNGSSSNSKSQIDYYWSVVNSAATKLKNLNSSNDFFTYQYPELYYATPDEKAILFLLNNIANKQISANFDKTEVNVINRVNTLLSNHLGLKNIHQKATYISMLNLKFDLTDDQFMAVTNTKIFFPDAITEKLTGHISNSQLDNSAYNSSINDSMMLFYRLFSTRYKKLEFISNLLEKLLQSIGPYGVIKLRTSINEVFLKKLGNFISQLDKISEGILKQLSVNYRSLNSTQDKIRVDLYKELFSSLCVNALELNQNIKNLEYLYSASKISIKAQALTFEHVDNFIYAVSELLEKDGDFYINKDLKEKMSNEKVFLLNEIHGEKNESDSETTVTFSTKGFKLVSTK